MTINKKLLLIVSVCVLSNLNGSDDELLQSPDYSQQGLTSQEIQSAFDKVAEEAYQESSQRTLAWIQDSLRKGLAKVRDQGTKASSK